MIRDPEAERERVMNDMESTVLKIKKFFYDNIGGDWAEASEVNAESKLGIDGKVLPPWKLMQRKDDKQWAVRTSGKESYVDYAKRTIQRLAPWHKWASDETLPQQDVIVD